jgi:predicted O-methyltransferase YrrM
MNVIDRIARLVLSYTEYAELDRESMRVRNHARRLVQLSFGFARGSLAPIQMEDEIVNLVEDVAKLAPKRVLEIGTSMGGTLFLWTRLSQPDATVISVDLPGGQFGGGYSKLRTPLYRKFAREQQKLHLLRANSHAPETLENVQSILRGEPLDFLFIDGDHTYEGAKADWLQYSPLVRKGGLVVFHDIAGNYDTTQVKRLWDEVKPNHETREYKVHPRGHYGIGVVVI